MVLDMILGLLLTPTTYETRNLQVILIFTPLSKSHHFSKVLELWLVPRFEWHTQLHLKSSFGCLLFLRLSCLVNLDFKGLGLHDKFESLTPIPGPLYCCGKPEESHPGRAWGQASRRRSSPGACFHRSSCQCSLTVTQSRPLPQTSCPAPKFSPVTAVSDIPAAVFKCYVTINLQHYSVALSWHRRVCQPIMCFQEGMNPECQLVKIPLDILYQTQSLLESIHLDRIPPDIIPLKIPPRCLY